MDKPDKKELKENQEPNTGCLGIIILIVSLTILAYFVKVLLF